MKILDCPLCGNNVISISSYNLEEVDYLKIECTSCHANIFNAGLDDDNGRNALIEKWNKRFYPDDIKLDLQIKKLLVKDKRIDIKRKEVELEKLKTSNEKMDYIKWILTLIESRDVTTEYDNCGLETKMIFKPTFSDLEVLTLKDKLFVLLNELKDPK